MSPLQNSWNTVDLKESSAKQALFLALVGVLIAVGTLMVYSSSMTAIARNNDGTYFAKHLAFLVISILGATLAAFIPARFWRQLAPFIYLSSILLLLLVLLPGFGHRVNGAQRWLRFGGLSFQPSEAAKLSVPLVICWMRSSVDRSLKPSTFIDLFKVVLLIGVPLGLILVEPDLGTTLFVAFAAALSLFLSGVQLRFFFCAGCLGVPAFIGLIALKPYQLARVQGFIQTWTNPTEAPYQVRQSLTTLGVGGVQGTGLGRGWQKLSFLPEANTDFVFSVIGEELGLIGTLGVIGLWIGVFLVGLSLIQKCNGGFEKVLATTLLTQLLVQAALNVAVVTAMVPPKGISHPLISYGGSNLVTSLVAIGMIVSLTRSEAAIEPHVDATLDPNFEDTEIDHESLLSATA